MIENLMARFADYLRHNEFSISPAAVRGHPTNAASRYERSF